MIISDERIAELAERIRSAPTQASFESTMQTAIRTAIRETAEACAKRARMTRTALIVALVSPALVAEREVARKPSKPTRKGAAK